jgi:hypothetical protein
MRLMCRFECNKELAWKLSNEYLSIEDKPRPGRSSNQESIKIVQQCLKCFPNISTRAISQHSHILKTTAIWIFTDRLLYKNELQMDFSFINWQSKNDESQYDSGFH